MSNRQLFSTQRVPGLDLMRGVTIIAMVVFHFSLLYYTAPTSNYARVVFGIGAFVGPLFLYLAGAGVWYFTQRYSAGRLFKRGLFLVALTFLISVFIKRQLYLDWTLIQDVGLAYLVMALIMRVTRYRFLTMLALYLTSVVPVGMLDALFVGVFPFLLFAPYFIAGYGFCAICPTMRQAWFGRAVIVPLGLALIFLMVGIWLGSWVQGAVAHFFAGVMWRIGVLMIFHFSAVYVLRDRRFDGRIGGTLVMLGHISLTSYYLQQVTLRVLQQLDFHPIIVNLEISHIFLTVVILVVMWLILKIWQRFNYAFSLEWLMRRL